MTAKRRFLAISLVLLAPAGAARASEYLEGTFLRLHYNDQGTWNDVVEGSDPVEYVGLEAIPDGDNWVDFTGSGTPWQHIIVAYTVGGSREVYTGTYSEENTTWDLLSEDDNSTSSDLVAQHRISAGELLIEKTETWGTDGAVISVDLAVQNVGSSAVTDIELMFVVDPDQDYDRSTTDEDGRTQNDVLDLINDDGEGDYAQSVGAFSGYSMSLGVCDPSRQEVGHASRNPDLSDTSDVLQDRDGNNSDLVMSWRHTQDSVAPDDEFHGRLLVVVGTTESVAQDLYVANVAACATCDADEDGYESLACGGDDCDDEDASANTGMAETWGDGIDNDCDGIDDNDDNDLDGVLDEYEHDNGMDYTTRDSDGDGYQDGDEVGDDPSNPVDSDGDGTIDALDTDDDDDGVLTIDEKRTDSDGDGDMNRLDPDDDDDGIPTLTEGEDDSDGDGAPDYLDRDSDDDGLTDATEGAVDTDGDGTANYLDLNSDDDDKDDETEADRDKDCDTVLNYVDADDEDGPCYEPPFQDWRGGGGATCAVSSEPGRLAWLGAGLLALLARRRRDDR